MSEEATKDNFKRLALWAFIALLPEERIIAGRLAGVVLQEMQTPLEILRYLHFLIQAETTSSHMALAEDQLGVLVRIAQELQNIATFAPKPPTSEGPVV